MTKADAFYGIVPLPPLERPLCWGLVTWQRHRLLQDRGITLHVYDLDGTDVTLRCSCFDDTPGQQRAVLFRHGPTGRPYVDRRGKVAREVLRSFSVREGLPL